MSAAALDASAKPTVAAIHGYALGGGLEHALACHYRIALPTAKLGLPEVALGLIPGGGGTQRLPRLVGAAVATDLLVSSRHVHAAEALKIGLISQIVPGTQSQELRDAAVSYAKAVAHAQPQRVRDLVLEPMDATTMDVLQAARREAAKKSLLTTRRHSTRSTVSKQLSACRLMRLWRLRAACFLSWRVLMLPRHFAMHFC